MSAIEFPEYLQQVQAILTEVIVAGHAATAQLEADTDAWRIVGHRYQRDGLALALPVTLLT